MSRIIITGGRRGGGKTYEKILFAQKRIREIERRLVYLRMLQREGVSVSKTDIDHYEGELLALRQWLEKMRGY